MNRREAIRIGALAGGAAMIPWQRFAHPGPVSPAEMRLAAEEIEKLRGESPARAEVRVERGAPRLFVNGREEFPLLIWTDKLIENAPGYASAGIRMLHPWVSLSAFWPRPGEYDFASFDAYLSRLLKVSPGAFFLFRVFLYPPHWWKNAHPSELVRYGIPTDPPSYKEEWGEGVYEATPWVDYAQPSYASEVWRDGTDGIFRAFIRHVEGSPLRSRVIGYHFCHGISHEWHYFHSRFLPDESEPMRKALGSIPDVKRRMQTTFGLVRDPEKEKDVIEFYRGFHELASDMVVHFARLVKEETGRRVLSGAFFLYLLENVWIQEAGHLAPEKILACKDIDFIATPYGYLSANIDGPASWDSDLLDDAGRWLGRLRGVGGDGGYRVLGESLRRHDKLFISEMDSSTFREPTDKRAVGGTGSDTRLGSIRIMERDLARMYASGSAGWFLDFGTSKGFGYGAASWYNDPAILEVIKKYTALGDRRCSLDLSPVARIAAVYDAKSFFATQHWKQTEPFRTGWRHTDLFNYWFLDAQCRPIHRIGAPVDFLYRFDLAPGDAQKYRLLLMPNSFYLTAAEVSRLREILRGSGTTVVWFYAPGYITPERLDLKQMEALTGFTYEQLNAPGRMMMRCNIEEGNELISLPFGIREKVYPRFAVNDPGARVLGRWLDNKKVSLAMKEVDGWTSVYAGGAPLPVEVLRWLAVRSGAGLWCDRPDIVVATRGTAAVVATDRGKRTLRFPAPMASAEGGLSAAEHEMELDFGEVRLFTQTG